MRLVSVVDAPRKVVDAQTAQSRKEKKMFAYTALYHTAFWVTFARLWAVQRGVAKLPALIRRVGGRRNA
jgi:hypothetical protein